MGHELAIGDSIVYLQPRYHCMIWGTIIGFTHKMVEIKRGGPSRFIGDVDKRSFDEVILDTRGWQRPTK